MKATANFKALLCLVLSLLLLACSAEQADNSVSADELNAEAGSDGRNTGRQLIWADVLEAEHRAPANMARDQYRHPLETLEFFGLAPCDTVVELWPGGAGWYSEILAALLRECGSFYAAQFDADSSVAFYAQSRAKYVAKLAAHPEVYDRLVVTTLQPPTELAIAPPGSADKVLTFRNIHNWLKAGLLDAVLTAAFEALKPGGILGVVEHRAKPGTDLATMIKSGYVTEAEVIARAEKAGFLLLDSSEINANPRDSADHPEGVWTLPPTLRLGEVDAEKYREIGESDRMTLKFGKPVYE